jgi:hypothetical protein
MINSIISSSSHVTVVNPPLPAVYNTGLLNVGQVRYNPITCTMEVYDGTVWQMLSNNATVGLTLDANLAIQWAIEKQKEEESLKKRMEQHPGLKDAYEKFQMLDILTRDYEKNEI